MAENECNITTLDAVKANLAIKTLGPILNQYGDEQTMRAYKALHECLRRCGEKDFPEVVALGGDT